MIELNNLELHSDILRVWTICTVINGCEVIQTGIFIIKNKQGDLSNVHVPYGSILC